MKPRRSILSVVREEKEPPSAPVEPATPAPAEPAPKPASKVKPIRVAKKHIGGYYPPNDPTIKAFQKLGIDLDKDQQEMLFEAISDFIAKHQASRAFKSETSELTDS
jgi:hypothetical protein